MKKIILIFLTVLLLACSHNKEIDHLIEKNPDLRILVDSLKKTSLIYKKCKACKFNGLEEEQLIGFTDRYPPKGNYDKKEIKIGKFEYDSYEIFDQKNREKLKGKLFICYFNQEQKQMFIDFFYYYQNRIGHYKQFCNVKYINNKTIISIENVDF